MTLKDQMAADLANIFFNPADFAETVAYTPAGGQAKSIAAVITYGDPEESGLSGMDALNTEAMLEIMADATNGIAVGEQVAIGAETWRVLYGHKGEDGLTWRCRISRSTR